MFSAMVLRCRPTMVSVASTAMYAATSLSALLHLRRQRWHHPLILHAEYRLAKHKVACSSRPEWRSGLVRYQVLG